MEVWDWGPGAFSQDMLFFGSRGSRSPVPFFLLRPNLLFVSSGELLLGRENSPSRVHVPRVGDRVIINQEEVEVGAGEGGTPLAT